MLQVHGAQVWHFFEATHGSGRNRRRPTLPAVSVCSWPWKSGPPRCLLTAQGTHLPFLNGEGYLTAEPTHGKARESLPAASSRVIGPFYILSSATSLLGAGLLSRTCRTQIGTARLASGPCTATACKHFTAQNVQSMLRRATSPTHTCCSCGFFLDLGVDVGVGVGVGVGVFCFDGLFQLHDSSTCRSASRVFMSSHLRANPLKNHATNTEESKSMASTPPFSICCHRSPGSSTAYGGPYAPSISLVDSTAWPSTKLTTGLPAHGTLSVPVTVKLDRPCRTRPCVCVGVGVRAGVGVGVRVGWGWGSANPVHAA